MDNEQFAKTLDDQIIKCEEQLKQALWLVEQCREKWIQLKIQKTMLFLNAGVGSLR